MNNLRKSESNILTDFKTDVLAIQVHNMANKQSNLVVDYLIQKLNETDYKYLGTNMLLHYYIASPNLSIPINLKKEPFIFPRNQYG